MYSPPICMSLQSRCWCPLDSNNRHHQHLTSLPLHTDTTEYTFKRWKEVFPDFNLSKREKRQSHCAKVAWTVWMCLRTNMYENPTCPILGQTNNDHHPRALQNDGNEERKEKQKGESEIVENDYIYYGHSYIGGKISMHIEVEVNCNSVTCQ